MKLNGNGNGNGKVYTESKYKQGMQFCPVCGRTNDWACRITEDEGLACCGFTPNENGKKDIHGRYKHILKTDSKSNVVTAKQAINENVTKTQKADADKLNEVYSALLDGLILNPNHSDDLLNRRKLSDTDISRNLYASVPAKNKITEIVHEFSKSHNLEGVPGFFFSGSIWRLNVDCAGYFIPYRDEKGRIVGLQVRKDKAVDKKYLWVSSSDKEKGATSGTPPHFVNAELPNGRNEIFLTEGALKADIIGSLLGVKVVATAGVAVIVPDTLLDTIFGVFPDLGRIVVAYDMDWQTNENVRLGLARLLDALDGKDVAVDVATWDISLGKGLDDVLVNKNYEQSDVRYIPVAEFREMLAVEAFNNVEEIVAEQSENTPIIEEPVVEYNEPIKDEPIADIEFVEKVEPDKDIDTFGITCRDFLAMDLPTPERVVWGLGRGNLGLMVASTNIGKTTLALNLSLSAGMDKTFSPLFDENQKARRVMYIDGEATKSELQADIRKMLESCSIEEQESIKDNLCFVCDEELNDEPLDLVNPDHLRIVTRKAIEFQPDLIIVDTLSALTLMEDENDNAIVKKEVLQPLKTLGRNANAGVLMLHHTGKFIEGSPQAEDSYKGRGASALGALSRVVYNLKKVSGSENQVSLSCSKVKGKKFEPIVMELDQNTRWFGIVVGASAKDSTKSEQDYWKVVDYVKNENRRAKRKEVVEKFTANKELSTSTVGRILERAVKNGDLDKDYGSYFRPELKGNTESENDDTQYCRVSRIDATKIYINPNQELAVKK